MLTGHKISHSEAPFLVNFDESHKPSQGESSEFPVDAKAVAEYSAQILSELRHLASGAKLTFLAYLIQVAVEEAKIQADNQNED